MYRAIYLAFRCRTVITSAPEGDSDEDPANNGPAKTKQKQLVVPSGEKRSVTDHNSQGNVAGSEEARNCSSCSKEETASGIFVFAWRSCTDSCGQMLAHRHDYWNCCSTTPQKDNGTMEESAAQTLYQAKCGCQRRAVLQDARTAAPVSTAISEHLCMADRE